jgi:DNA adenine methylase
MMDFRDPPPLRYFGSKWQMADWIIAQMPPHLVYVEPYCGSAGVFFRKPASPLEVLNDLNGDVVNFFTMLRDRRDDLIQAIDLTPFSRAEYDRSFEACADPLEQARRFYVRSYQSFAGGGVRKSGTGWRRRFGPERSNPKEWSRLDGLLLGARRLKEAVIECDQALNIIQVFDSETTLFYVDPPYVLQARRRKQKRYVHEMSEADHRQLAEALHAVKGMVLLSGYQSPLYDELYGDWVVTSKTNTTNGNSTSVEYLWTSPRAADVARLPLFSWGG